MDLDTVKFNLDWIWMIMLEWTLVGHLTIWIWISIQFQAVSETMYNMGKFSGWIDPLTPTPTLAASRLL